MSRKILLPVAIALFTLLLQFSSKASYTSSYSYNNKRVNHFINNDSLQLLEIEQRVKDIQSMDLTHLSPIEKRDLRQELIQMMKEAKTYNQGIITVRPGIYLSAGAIIVIIIVLLLVLR